MLKADYLVCLARRLERRDSGIHMIKDTEAYRD